MAVKYGARTDLSSMTLSIYKLHFTKKWDQGTHDYLGKKYGIVQENFRMSMLILVWMVN